MDPKISYLDPTKYYNNAVLRDEEALSNVLVLLPSYRGPALAARRCVDTLTACGSNVIASYMCSDPALHRCLVASRALEYAESHPEIIDSHYVIWIDDDMTFTPSHVAMLRDMSAELYRPVTGLYCKRTSSLELTAKIYTEADAKPKQLSLGVDAIPVTAGMGCLLLPLRVFVDHCREVPSCTFVVHGKPTTLPGICASGMSHGIDGTIGWMSEDQVYCESLWYYGYGLYAVPIRFGHLTEVSIYPSDDARWLPNV